MTRQLQLDTRRLIPRIVLRLVENSLGFNNPESSYTDSMAKGGQKEVPNNLVTVGLLTLEKSK
ncbi:hypothetical protein CHS0354_016905 [Potamilus streckersoni]|uniref:Uncharacterized protein n=1 Tax=Potamilus streckersoni TaxID=2493646 RepID=A0AAE0S6Z8_9BIVA|nr:hypothetical protein CHS0354_016905 [Potamilus streckersoni]